MIRLRGWSHWRARFAILLATGWGLTFHGASSADVVTLTRVIGVSAPVDGVAPSNASPAPTLSGGQIGFQGYASRTGYYLIDAQTRALTTLVREGDTALPGMGQWSGCGWGPVNQGTDAAFSCYTTVNLHGLFTNIGGQITRIVDRTVPLPGSGVRANHAGAAPSVENGAVAFSRTGTSGADGVFTWTASGGIKFIAELPRTGSPAQPFNFFALRDVPVLSGGIVAVGAAMTGPTGNGILLYDTNGNYLGLPIAKGMALPGAAGTIADVGMGGWTMDHSNFLFAPTSSSGFYGVYKKVGGVISMVAGSATPIPGGSGNFDFSKAAQLALDGNTSAFLASGSGGQQGIYADFGAGLVKIVDRNTNLDGATPTGFLFRDGGLSGNKLAFIAEFADGTRSIYEATVPAPGTFTLALAVLAHGSRRRRPTPVAMK